MAVKVDLRLKPLPGTLDTDIEALIPRKNYGAHGAEVGAEPHGRWLTYRIIGPDRVKVASKLAVNALASGLFSDAEVRTMKFGERPVVETEKAANL